MCDVDGKSSSESSINKGAGVSAVSVAGRIAGMGLAVASAALMATASQCTVYGATPAAGARPRTVTYSSYGPFVFLVVANAMASFLGAIAVFLSVWGKKTKKKNKGGGGWHGRARVLMPLLDAAVPALLYSSSGAAFAAAGGDGLTYCSAYGRRVSVCGAGGGSGSSNFCSQVRVAIYLSLGSAVAVSSAKVVGSVPLSMSLGGGGDGSDDSESSCSSESGACDHGCHQKH